MLVEEHIERNLNRMSNPNDKKDERSKDPAQVPRFGRFFLHDDREKGRGSGINSQRKPRQFGR